jgi:hypothetical protein
VIGDPVFIEHIWTATVGPKNAAWLADPRNFDGEHVADDNGDGTVTVTSEHKDVLNDRGNLDRVGDLEWDDEREELGIWLPYDEVGAERMFWYPLMPERREVAA